MSRINLPEDILKKMVCLNCKGLLSLYPVYVKKDNTGAVCGRCQPVEKDKYIRDEAYEALAQFLLFPCAYKVNGCSKYLTPNVIEEHEPCCKYRKFICPSTDYTKCNWEGTHNLIFKHFEDNHDYLLINEQKFNIDFYNSVDEKLLMKVNNELFIIKKDIHARKEIFLCTVEHLKSQEKDEKFSYFLKIESENKNYFYKCHERLADGSDTTKLTAELLKDKLQDPSSMVVTVELVKAAPTQFESAPETLDQTSDNPKVDWQMLSELECPVCFEYMLPHIYQCTTGHSICKNCKPKVNNSCPTCKKSIQSTQNFVLEKMTQFIVYPCKHFKLGCKFSSKAVDIEAHESCCEFGPFQCPLSIEGPCDWSGVITELIPHIENAHEEFVLKGDRIELEMKFTGTFWKNNLIIFNKKVFKFTFRYRNAFCQWGVQFIGSAKDCEKYKFEVDIFDTTGGKKRFLITRPVVPLSVTLDRANVIQLSDETIRSYVKDKLAFLLRISLF